MNRIFSNIKETYQKGSTLIQLIYINSGAFIILFLLNLILTLFQIEKGNFIKYFVLPADIDRLLTQPWSIISYMFLHTDIWHILFNMLCLYWFGKLFLQFFSAKHLRGLYLLGGICGGCLYIISLNIFPYFNPVLHQSVLLGASASILAIMAAIAIKEPDYQVQILFIGPIRLKYIALFTVLFDLLFMLTSNSGGHLAHLGGILAGIWFTLGLNKGHDITKWINKVLDFPSHSSMLFHKKPKMKIHYGGKQQDYDFNAQKKAHETQINRILEKIKQSGYGSLSSEEKKELFDASKR